MFTGIVQSMGFLKSVIKNQTDCRMCVQFGNLNMRSSVIGDSIAVNGVCLTVIKFDSESFTADISNETLSKTTLGDLKVQQTVNLEKALTLSTPLGGHLVSGHVDAVGVIKKRFNEGKSVRLSIEVPAELSKYIAQKGSVCVDGISLTVNAVDDSVFELNIVPHTLLATTMGSYQMGQYVNIEVDLLARYLERLMQGNATDTSSKNRSVQEMNEAFLQKNGFIK